MSEEVNLETYLSQRVVLLKAELLKRQQQVAVITNEITQIQGKIHELNLLQQNLKRRNDTQLSELNDETDKGREQNNR